MKLITTTAFAIFAATAAVPASAQAPAAPAAKAPTVKPSSKALKAIIDLQATVKKGDFANVPAKVAAAQAVATTKDDRYLIAALQLEAAAKSNDLTAGAAAADAVAASGGADQAALATIYSGLAGSFYNAKQYDRAAAAYARALTYNPNDLKTAELLAESQVSAGHKAEAAASFQRAIQIQKSAGQKIDEALLKRAVGVAYDAQSPMAVDLARQWAASYPSADSWRNSIAIYRNIERPDVEGTLDLLRLMQATNAMTSSGDYALFARSAADQNNYNEAQAVLDAGIAAKVVNPASPDLRDLVVGLKTKPKATAADLAEATKAAVNGMALLRIGDRYYAMGDYAKAVELYRMSMGKPGVDAAVANLHIGMALARAGDKAGATAALNAVTGPRADIAKFWLTYVNQRA